MHYTGKLEIEDSFLLYEEWGNADGIPIIFLHGGPGLGCSDSDKIYFDPNHHRVIFLEQRGSVHNPALSLPLIRPFLMVEDIRILLDKLQVEKVHIFGGSWGATLAMLFAIAYPKKVASLILRGSFTGEKAMIRSMLDGHNKCPCWLEFTNEIPPGLKHTPESFYFNKLQENDAAIRYTYARKWSKYAYCLNRQPQQKFIVDENVVSKALLTAYFSINNCFLPEQYIRIQVSKLRSIPTWFVHGIHDLICPLNLLLPIINTHPKATLIEVNAGHFAHEPAIESTLIKLVQSVYK